MKHEADSYLIADAASPLVTCGDLKAEMLLYNVDQNSFRALQIQYQHVVGKSLALNTEIAKLSGGQKVVLMILLALFSPASQIRFINIMQALDPKRRKEMLNLISQSDKQIIIETKAC